MTPREIKLLFDKGLCYQCLSSGASSDSSKHKTASCFSKFICRHKAHSSYPRKKHVLLCEVHKHDAEKDIIKNYKLASKDPKDVPRLPDFVGGETDLMALS